MICWKRNHLLQFLMIQTIVVIVQIIGNAVTIRVNHGRMTVHTIDIFAQIYAVLLCIFNQSGEFFFNSHDITDILDIEVLHCLIG